ncbi:MAG: hypothetical protein M5U26_27745 [Planctomycetota bacterium]|nr:hypothetical protein [Planctomycetota bacterium]
MTVNKLTGAFTVVARNVALQEIMELYAGATLKRGVGSRAVAMSLNDPLTAPLTLDAVPFRLTFGTDPTLTQFIFQGVTEIGMTYSIRRANTVGKAAYQFGKTGTPPTPFTFIDSASLAQRRLPGDVYVSQLRATLCLVPDPLNTNTDPYDPTDPASTMDITVGGLALFNLVNTNFTGRNGNFTARNPAPGLLSVTFNNQTYKLTLVTDWLDPLANFGVEPVVDSRGDAPFSRQSIYFPIQVDLDTTDTHFATVLLGRQGTTFKTATPTVVFPPAP